MQCSNDRIKQSEYLFYLGLLCRLITSAVTDGDRTDTANFMMNKEFDREFGGTVPWEKICSSISKKIQSFPVENEIGKTRKEISDICQSFNADNCGVYRLNIPTGGGKTLSALRFAAAHALKTGKSKIIYVAPFISILEQNARVI